MIGSENMSCVRWLIRAKLQKKHDGGNLPLLRPIAIISDSNT